MEQSLELDGRLTIDAEVLPNKLLHMVGECTRSQAIYPGGVPQCEVKKAPWVLRQRDSSGDNTWCSPFQGLFEAMRHALQAGSTLTTSMQVEGAESEEKTDQGLHCEHEYSVQGAVQVSSDQGHMEKLIILQNPWLKGEWTGSRGDWDRDWWTPERRQQARLPMLNDDENAADDDGLFAIPHELYTTNFTRLDASNNFLPSISADDNAVDSGPATSSAAQLLGMITQQCGGATHWWRNPRFMIKLKEQTNLTIILNEPNTKVLGLPREQFDVEIGFRVVMDVLFSSNSDGSATTTDMVTVDHGDPNLRQMRVQAATGAACMMNQFIVYVSLTRLTIPKQHAAI